MNTYNVNSDELKSLDFFKEFIKNNPKNGFLKIRAYAASGAIPIKGLKVTISKVIGNNTIIFFEGSTNESGIIEGIVLPAPNLDSNDLNIPNSTTYDLIALYAPDNIKRVYKVNIYEGVYVVQNINIIPSMGDM